MTHKIIQGVPSVIIILNNIPNGEECFCLDEKGHHNKTTGEEAKMTDCESVTATLSWVKIPVLESKFEQYSQACAIMAHTW